MKKALVFCIPLLVLSLLFAPQVFAESTVEKQAMEQNTDSQVVLSANQEQAVSTKSYISEQQQAPLGEKVLISGMIILMALSVVFVVISEKRKTYV